MGYSLDIVKYEQEKIKKVAEENLDFTFSGEGEFNFYKNIFKENEDETSWEFGERLGGKNIWSESAFYSFFIPITNAYIKCVGKELPNFKVVNNMLGLEWKLEDPESMTEEQDNFLYGVVALINYMGDSSGWTWTWQELKNGKELLIKHNMWDEVASQVNRKGFEGTTLGQIYDKVIENKAVLELH